MARHADRRPGRGPTARRQPLRPSPGCFATRSEITARFPDGLTVMTGTGQWRGEDDQIVQERSILVILLYPRDAVGEGSAMIEEIRAAYEREFSQESVLRASDNLPVCVSF